MNVGDQLVGILSLDHNGTEHEYTTEEITLAKAIAKLAALVIEDLSLLGVHDRIKHSLHVFLSQGFHFQAGNVAANAHHEAGIRRLLAPVPVMAVQQPPARGHGWKRDNSFLTHKAKGSFCYGFYPHGSHPAGKGTKYRATAEGPGVTPDVMWAADDIGPYDAAVQQQMRALERSWGDPKCRT